MENILRDVGDTSTRFAAHLKNIVSFTESNDPELDEFKK